MKKKYPVSEKAKEWAKHLRPFGKRLANKSTRKINKTVKFDGDYATKPGKEKTNPQFAIEYSATGLRGWKIWKRYVTQTGRDRALENVTKKYGNSSYGFLKDYHFRAKDLKNNNPKINKL